MSLEAATNISQLNASNPVSNDPESQGDDHIRMIKLVLQNAFPNQTKPFINSSATIVASSFSVTSVQENSVFLVDCTVGAVEATLPALAVGDAGWQVSFIKTDTGVNPLFILPAAGTIQSGEYAGLTKTRRGIPGRRTRVIWTGTAFIAERVCSEPIGTVLDNWLPAIPVGYAPANGVALSSAANFPDYNTAKGSLVIPDATGRVVAGLEAAATRLTAAGAGIDGGVLGAAGGAQTHVLTTAQLAAHSHGAGSYAVADPGIFAEEQVMTNVDVDTLGNLAGGGGQSRVDDVTPEYLSDNTLFLDDGSITGFSEGTGSGTAHQNTQPTIVMRKIVVVE